MAMSWKRKGIFYRLIIFGFFVASKLMRQKAHLQGADHLKKIPTPVLFTVTHDSYWEIPSLSRVYYALKPKPNFLIMAKNEFLGGRYLSQNFARNNRFLQWILRLLDRTGIPTAVFRSMNLVSIERPFMDKLGMTRQVVRNILSGQINCFRQGALQGLSTLIFPEGTTWGYGGLKKIRSSAHQIVQSTFQAAGKEVYLLPINVKVDRLVAGTKDVFIKVGKPFFMNKQKEEFNRVLSETLNGLHTITFSQIAAFYLKHLAEVGEDAAETMDMEKKKFIAAMERITQDLHRRVRARVLPHMDPALLNRLQLLKKINGFLKYCRKSKYILAIRHCGQGGVLVLNRSKILADHSQMEYRKLNPLGYHANELTSLGEDVIRSVYDRHMMTEGRIMQRKSVLQAIPLNLSQ